MRPSLPQAALPVPPLPPLPPLRLARAEPRRPPVMPRIAPIPAYDADPATLAWGRGRMLPYPGQYALGVDAYYGRLPLPYGW